MLRISVWFTVGIYYLETRSVFIILHASYLHFITLLCTSDASLLTPDTRRQIITGWKVELSTNLREVSQWPEKAPNCFQGGEGLSDLLWTLHCETLQRFVASSTKDFFVENKPHASEHRTESRIWKMKNSYRIFLDSVTNIFRTIDTWVNSVQSDQRREGFKGISDIVCLSSAVENHES